MGSMWCRENHHILLKICKNFLKIFQPVDYGIKRNDFRIAPFGPFLRMFWEKSLKFRMCLHDLVNNPFVLIDFPNNGSETDRSQMEGYA